MTVLAVGAAGAASAGGVVASCARAADESATAVVTSRPPARVLRVERNPFGVLIVIGEISSGWRKAPGWRNGREVWRISIPLTSKTPALTCPTTSKSVDG
jgi:hypothetical protein